MPTKNSQKKERKKPLWPGVSLGVMLSLVVGAIAVQVTQEVSVDRHGRWRNPPRVQVCTTAPGWVLDEVAIAVEWWEAQHEADVFGGVVRGDCTQLCDPGTLGVEKGRTPTPCAGLGTISVDVPGVALPVTHAGQTTTMVWRDEIQWSVVELASLTGPEEAARAWTVAHELGHALGYQHAQGRRSIVVKHHVLSPSYAVGGFGTSGMGFAPSVE